MIVKSTIVVDSLKIECFIESKKDTYKIGETPDINVQLINNSNQSIYLIGALDGAEEKWRMPYCYFTIIKPQPDSVLDPFRCGNVNSLGFNDFVKIDPNQYFDPYMQIDDYGFFDSYELSRKENFRQEGTYKIQFHYSTKSDSIEKYIGDWYDFNNDSINTLFSQVPRFETSSNVIEVEFKK
jgi:hypothetical protein